MSQLKKATQFHALHSAANPLVLYNIWDAASAKSVENAGATAAATGSWSLAAAQGFADGEIIPLPRVITTVTDIVAQSGLPVSLDFECGYADDLATLTNTFAQVIAAGVVGVNFEDQILDGSGLMPIEDQQARIVTLVKTAERVEIPMFINARTDIFLQSDPGHHVSRVEAAIERGQAYAESGASGFFIPGLTDPDAIRRICEAVAVPVNIMASGTDLDVGYISDLGVSRVSFGPNPFRDLMAKFDQMARNIYGNSDR